MKKLELVVLGFIDNILGQNIQKAKRLLMVPLKKIFVATKTIEIFLPKM